MGTIEVLVPIVEVKVKEIRMAERPSDLNGKALGLLWNQKPNGNLLLKELEERLNGRYRLRGTRMREKALASSEAPSEVIEELSVNSDLVILAIGD